MKTFTLKNKHFRYYYSNFQASTDFNIIMQLYYIAKAEASAKQLPLLPSNDFRKPVPGPSIAMKHAKMRIKQLITEQIHTLTAPLFKKTAA